MDAALPPVAFDQISASYDETFLFYGHLYKSDTLAFSESVIWMTALKKKSKKNLQKDYS
jgi:hypothetical protein